MKLLLINGSPKRDGEISRMLTETAKLLRTRGFETEEIRIGDLAIRGCVGCEYCKREARCVICDTVNEAAEKFSESDGIIVASPTAFGSPSGTVISFLDRLFISTGFDKSGKLGVALSPAGSEFLCAYFENAGMRTPPRAFGKSATFNEIVDSPPKKSAGSPLDENLKMGAHELVTEVLRLSKGIKAEEVESALI